MSDEQPKREFSDDHLVRGTARRSIWSGLTASEIEELGEATRHLGRRSMAEPERWRDVSDEYARRTVSALVTNDLRAALRSAMISTAALERSVPR